MKIETRTIYIAEDGDEFKTQEECLHHEKLRELEDFLDNNSIYGKVNLSTPEDLGEFLIRGKDIILPYMGWTEISEKE